MVGNNVMARSFTLLRPSRGMLEHQWMRANTSFPFIYCDSAKTVSMGRKRAGRGRVPSGVKLCEHGVFPFTPSFCQGFPHRSISAGITLHGSKADVCPHPSLLLPPSVRA